MALIQWSSALSVDVPTFDAEHQKLIGFLNDLHDAMLQGRGRDALAPILNGLIGYTKTHFAHEERLMEQHAYPRRTHHRQAHAALVAKVNSALEKQKAGSIAVTTETMTFLKDWLTVHIGREDKQYGEFFAARGVR